MNKNLYNRKPFDFKSDIPIFSLVDDYVRNYEAISEDHLKGLREYGINPFMEQEQINQSEKETRLMVRKHVDIGTSILDAGIGLGDLFSDFGDYDRYGVDISLPYLKKAKSKGINVAMAKLEELPYSDGYFDAVVSCDVLEHVLKLDCAVEQLLRVLKPAGKLIVRVPNEENLDSYLTDFLPYSHMHVRDFSLTSLKLYMEKCHGLKCIDHKLIGYQFNSFYQMKYKFPEKNSKLRSYINIFFEEKTGGFDSYEEGVLQKLMATTYEDQGDVLIAIRDSMPDLFKIIAPEIINPIELVAVFESPL
jgi:ubiquinone/menaquinone biosynthesis C-methylase UbiE